MAEASCGAGAASRSDLMRRLRGEVERLIPAQRLSALADGDSLRARSELNRACEQVFLLSSWSDVEPALRRSLAAELSSEVFGYGVLDGLLRDPAVTEVMVNGTRNVYCEREGALERSPVRFDSEEQIRAFVDRVLGPLGRRVDASSPLVDARLPQGYRVNVALPPVAVGGTAVTIRKFPHKVMTLDDLERRGSVESDVAKLLRWAVLTRRSIAVSGGTGSGKTTLLNALSCLIPANERIVTVEDLAELRFHEHPHVVSLEARPSNAEGAGRVSIRDLVANALRMRPDRIVVGECRGAEALDMLQAMNTGHDGSLTTLHANSPADSVARLTAMVRFGCDLPVEVIEGSIASAIDLIVQVARTSKGSRVVCQVAEPHLDSQSGRCEVREVYRRRGLGGQGVWLDGPSWMGALLSEGVLEDMDEREVTTWLERTRGR
ncbi:CpaF family protein [Eggerthellaceae bacterium zg-1084]|uniref:CpaF family protein n=2 Tax=Berryella wangjianweii TaxID=2734634 RepID=A0A6M8J940_9ACTN|nr:CpaF family protein [Berryella wangjianweii]QKF08018.1 CpaF family protein [Berryella wangjianweii]